MIYFFPMPYPDESLYNIFVRYNKLTGNNNYTATVTELVGNRYAHINFYFPNNLEYLCKQLPEKCSINPDYFIQSHTILPVYKPFTPDERFNNAINNFKNTTKSLGSSIASIGYTSGSLFKVNGIAYCPECIIEDKEKFGEAYIHRSHQIDSNFICLKHRYLLHVYQIPENKEFVKFYDINELDLSKEKIIHENFHDLKLTSNIDKLLKYYYEMPYFNLTKEKYKSMLYKKGYYHNNGNVCQYRLHQDFINYHTQEYLLFLKSNVDSNNRNSWLEAITTNNELSIHPIRHLLFIDFLFGEIEDFINYNNVSIPSFAKGNLQNINNSHSLYNLKTEKYKHRLLDLLKKEPTLNRIQIYEKARTSYEWLSKYEKEWMESILPKSTRGKEYWDEKDSFYYLKVYEVIHNILNLNSSEIITIQHLTRILNFRFAKHLNKMPKTRALINEFRETPREYYKRKIKFTINELDNFNINPSIILNKVQVPLTSYNFYLDYTNNLLKSKNNDTEI